MESRVEISRLSSYSFDEAVTLWNEGFQGYAVDLTMSLDQYLARLHYEGISPRHSLVASIDNKTCGFLLNGFRIVADQKFAWNGGTGVIPEFRGQGIGQTLVKSAVDLYQSENISFASLEAIQTNHAAINLYKRFGYETVDHLVVLRRDGSLGESSSTQIQYTVALVRPEEVGQLSFYRTSSAWQTQWQNVNARSGEGLLLRDGSGKVQAYALFAKQVDDSGRVGLITLYQCEVDPDCPIPYDAVRATLQNVFGPFDLDCRRATSNLGRLNRVVVSALEAMGFELFIEQLHMVKKILV